MKSVGTKIRERREELLITQTKLAEMTGISHRTIFSYEKDDVVPRTINLRKVCEVLGVTPEYLTNPEIDDPEYGKDTQPYVDAVRDQYGSKGARDFQGLLDGSLSMMAGGDVPQEDKEKFFEAIAAAYLQTKKDASERFTPKKYRKD